ncbi:hypothetical protein AMTRI_Chr09g16540 [Amborella trichopoda]
MRRRRSRLPPFPPRLPPFLLPFLVSRRPSNSAPARSSSSTPTSSRHLSTWSLASPSFWSTIYDLYPKPLRVPHKASLKGVQSFTHGSPQSGLPTTDSGSFAQVVARSSPPLPFAGSPTCPKESPPLCSKPLLSPFFVSIPPIESSLLKTKLQSSSVGTFRPSWNDFRGVEIWTNFFWEDSNITARCLSCGDYLFTFSSQALACQVLQHAKSAIFKGATLCLHAWSPQEGSFRRQKVWLTLHHVPLHGWPLATFGRIAESCGSLISIRWKSLETLSLGSILLLVEVLDPKCIPPCVWIEVDNLFYPISLAWTEASPHSDNKVDSNSHSLLVLFMECRLQEIWLSQAAPLPDKRRHRRNHHDLFPGKRVYRPSSPASQRSSQWIPRDTPPSLSGDDDVRESAPNACVRHTLLDPISEGGGVGNSCHLPSDPPVSLNHRPGKEVIEDPGPLAFFKDPSSLVGAENWASVADLIHEGRNSLDKGTPATLTPETTATFLPPFIASAAGVVLSYDASLSAQETFPSFPLPLGLPKQHPPDGPPNAVLPSILPNLEDPPRPSSSFPSTPPCRSSLGLSEDAYTIAERIGSSHPLHPESPSILSQTFLPLPFFCHSDPSLFASSLLVEVDPPLLPFGIITIHSLHPSPPDLAHLSELLGPWLSQPSLVIPLGRITMVLFPYEISPSSPLPLSLSGPLPSPQLHVGTLLVHHPLLLPPRLTLFQCLLWFCPLFLD